MPGRGSLWNRWDPHLHAPGTLLNDQFKGDWGKYFDRIESASPIVRALGVTDYFSIEAYKEFLRQRGKRLPNVQCVFPNVEMRLDVSTERKAALNLHLLFSPEDPNHVQEIERILGRLEWSYKGRPYSCTLKGLEELGRAVDPLQSDARGARALGAQQFKPSLGKIQDLFKEDKWLRENCLVAVSGNTTDGTGGLQKDSAYRAYRIEIESFAHFILSGAPAQREFWLGKKEAAPRAYIEKTYGCLKPCIHGSDAHAPEDLATPDLERLCWIKGELMFETLRQVVLEPQERIWIGSAAPESSAPSLCISELTASGTAWLESNAVPLNPGLVAIIGARGSGKTALMDMLAAGAAAFSSEEETKGSFLERASEFLAGANVQLTWGDGESEGARPLSPGDQAADNYVRPSVCYLSQHFVERLCSSAGLAVALRKEMERVIFESLDPINRMETTSFDDLTGVLLDPVRVRRSEIRETIAALTDQVVKEQLAELNHPRLVKQRDEMKQQITKDKLQLSKLLPKGQEARAKRLADVEEACARAETKAESIRRRRQLVDELVEEVENAVAEGDARSLADLKRRFSQLELSDTDWKAFGRKFVGDVPAILAKAKETLDKALKVLMDGDLARPIDKAKSPLPDWPIALLRIERDAIRKEVGADAHRQKAYADLQRLIAQKEVTLRKLDAEVVEASESPERRKVLIAERRDAYRRLVGTFVKEEEQLATLYEPLSTQLESAHGALRKLAFVVRRNVDLDAWVAQGEKLLDLRKASGFMGRGSLKSKAAEYLLQPWTKGSADEVSEAMDRFSKEHWKDLLAAKPSFQGEADDRRWTQSVAAWLFSADHLSVVYGIEYDGVPVERLSPGTRGIVLLLLYLAIDKQDRRPLLIDQPEENLDPKSVYEELVPYFREARVRRQVIIVTHNANLVVNTDADQVIIATSVPDERGGMPTIKYKSGAIEEKDVRDTACEILEGGRKAFVERALRYRIYFRDAYA
jgi:ABC-type lipoprotein export system ATPase subunit